MNIPLFSQSIKVPQQGLFEIGGPAQINTAPIDSQFKRPTSENFFSSIQASGPSTTFDQALLRTLNVSLENGNQLMITPNRTINDIEITKPMYLSKDELRQISFDTILDQPLSLNSLFSEEIKDLVKNLVEIQKSKAQYLQNINNEQFSDSNTIKTISDVIPSNATMQLENSNQVTPQINHLLNSNQLDSLNKENSSERKSTHKQKPSWDDQSDIPYFDKTKKEAAGIAKKLLSRLGKGLEKFSNLLQETANK